MPDNRTRIPRNRWRRVNRFVAIVLYWQKTGSPVGAFMEQSWTAFWARVSDAFHQALAPFRAVAGAFGQHPSDIQIWCFLCGVFFLAVVAIQTYGDIMLRRRGAFATGKVIGIDKSSDGRTRRSSNSPTDWARPGVSTRTCRSTERPGTSAQRSK
ncbi:hypothetical protein [Mesorhizobium sp. WSM4989]|nr:hypothetical protein [Mesorhizobium sp. WSM4989]MDG4919835.1 hypothetical protein [Mesorhizobium sp. WSM4989]